MKRPPSTLTQPALKLIVRSFLRRLGEEHVRSRRQAAREPAPEPREPVSVDDVLEIHEFLQDFDGDFIKLFRGQ